MNVYVESNFVLELALMQEESASCENLLSLCQASQAILLIPAVSLAEPYETVVRRGKDRKAVSQKVAYELEQLARSKPYQIEVASLQGVSRLLNRSGDEEQQRLYHTRHRLLQMAEIIPLSSEVLSFAAEAQMKLNLSPPDAVVYASVLHHLSLSQAPKKCFLNRNSHDFSNPEIMDTLNRYGCKMLFSFEKGYNYIRSQGSFLQNSGQQ